MEIEEKCNQLLQQLAILLSCFAIQNGSYAADVFLSHRNTEVPFCYLEGDARSWPILEEKLPAGSRISFVASQGEKILDEGEQLDFSGLKIVFNQQKKIEIISQPGQPAVEFSLAVLLQLPNGQAENQRLVIRPAPPQRPITYLADFGDDMIRIFMDSHDGHWRPITKCSFDQYFRRCQAHGVQRLILWLQPFPYLCDPANYASEDWDRYEKQARAMLESQLLDARIKAIQSGGQSYVGWDWIRQQCGFRMQRDFGAMISESAVEHGISLTASFRPFETALTKYYEIPAFDHRGAFLWGFLPAATPAVNYHPEETCFAHYRTVLKQMGHEDAGRVGSIELPGVENAEAFLKRFESARDNLRIVASHYAPIQKDALVLQRLPDGEFTLRLFGEFEQQAAEQQTVLKDFGIEKYGEGLRITNLEVPADIRFLILSNPSAAEAALDLLADLPVRVFAKAGNRLSRGNVYWSLDASLDPTGLTRVAGIPATGRDHAEFHATEHSQKLLVKQPNRLLLRGHQVVIDLGAPWSVEMLDLNRPAMRENVLKEMQTLLDLPAFDELIVNTRSHVSLAASMADGDDGVQSFLKYRKNGKKIRAWLGIDRAYAPLSVSDDPILQQWANDPKSVEKITTWQANEWFRQCQSDSTPFRWRFTRNQEVAAGVRQLLFDFEKAFPGVRTRIVMPLREQAVYAAKDELETLVDAKGKPYGRDYSSVWSTINHIPTIGEGMAMVDLTGLSTEPVVFGVRGLPDAKPLDVYLRHSFSDLADNHGSSFRGPRSFFFEAQASLRRKDQDVARRRRGEIVCECLAYTAEINEVIYYEAADWLYYLPLAEPEICGHAYVEDVVPHSTAKSDPGNSRQEQ